MAVIVSNGNINLSSINGFMRSDSYNIGTNHYNNSALVTSKSQVITFSNLGLCKGALLYLNSRSYYPVVGDRTFTLDLEEISGTCTVSIATPGLVTLNAHGFIEGEKIRFSSTGAMLTGITLTTLYYVRYINANTFNISTTPAGALVNFSGTQSGIHTCWVVRDTKSLTPSQLNPELLSGTATSDAWNAWVPFSFDDGGYNISTISNAWRLTLWVSSGTLGNVAWSTSNTTINNNYSYITYSDNLVTANSGFDAIFCKDTVIIDRDFTLKAYQSPDDLVNAYCGGTCRNLDISKENVCNLRWIDSPLTSYTFTLDGLFIISSYSGLSIGSILNPIPSNKQAIISCPNIPTLGTGTTSSFWQSYQVTTAANRLKASLFLYGQVPTKTYAVLANDAQIGQAQLICTEDMSNSGWKADDYIAIGKQNIKGQGVLTWQQILSISGNIITLKTNLASYIRISGAIIINRDAGYGIKFTRPNSTYSSPTWNAGLNNHLEISGCIFYQGTISSANYLTIVNSQSQPQYRSQHIINDNLFWSESTGYYTTLSMLIPPEGFSINRNIYHRCTSILIPVSMYYQKWKSGVLTYKDNKHLCFYSGSFNGSVNTKSDFQNNIYQNSIASSSAYTLSGINPICKNNYFWGWGTTTGTITIGQTVGGIASNNHFDNCMSVYAYGSITAFGFKIINDYFGTEVVNTVDILSALGGGYVSGVFKSPSGNLTFDNTYLPDLSLGSSLAFTNLNNNPQNDLVLTPLGKFQRTGDLLSDTTTRTQGPSKFAIRFESTNPDELLEWSFKIPTGNIINKTIIVGLWVKINSINYYAGQHQLPRLTILYDDETNSGYAQAASHTDWQFLFIPITPLTTSGQISITLSTKTEATLSDAYIYMDDVSVFYPPDSALNLGGLDLWDNGLPITPPISIQLSASDIWGYIKDYANVTGSIGEFLGSLATEANASDNKNDLLNGLATTESIQSLDEKVTLIKSIEMGKWKLSQNQMIFYSEDNITEIARFDLKDSFGNPSMTNVFERVKV